MDQAFFIHGFGEGETSFVSHCRKEDGKGFSASHPPFSLSTKPFGNSDRGFPTHTSLPLVYGTCGSFTLSDYNSKYLDGCGLYCISQTPHKAASSILPLKDSSSYLNPCNLLQNCNCNTKKGKGDCNTLLRYLI